MSMMHSMDEQGINSNVSVPSPHSGDVPEGAILMYTTKWCGDCFRAKRVMETLRIPFREIDITVDEDAAARVLHLNNGFRSVPTLVFPDGSVMTEPPIQALVQKLQSLG